ncbi:MAG: hypothetical protein QY323_05765 [Patescibacteria group bacterium]|nr:MAG: hypothetical protein QY323_05765 [Patescibacteria group bacterium]
MPPRRKKTESEAESQDLDALSPEAAKPKPKPKRAPRAKKPAEVKPSEPEPVVKPPERIPAIIPIKTPLTPAPRISIEPDILPGQQEEEPWKPMLSKSADLSLPPKPLMQNKKVTAQDVEDIMAADDDEDPEYRSTFQMPVRTGIYRKIALGFAVLALVVGAGVAYVVYAQATVSVFPQKAEVTTERVLTVTATPQNADEIPGQVAEVTVAGEKTGVPETSTKTDGIATGTVTLINETSSDQVLIPTTRLLSNEGILFRLKARVNVPAKGRVQAEAYADKAGESGNIAPTRFTIPGLNAALQESIYAESEAAMTGGIVTVGTISSADIEKTENALRQELIAQARAEFAEETENPWTGHALVAETMARNVSAGPGETANGVTVRLTLRVRAVDFDRVKAVAASAEDLKRSLTSDRELIGVKVDDSSFTIDKADAKAGTASLRVALTGQTRVSLESPLFDAEKLRGLGLEDVQTYFEGIEGVERVDVKFRPFWLKRMPLLPDRIEFQVEK